ncbi:MAG TPA: UDP-3-O-acyl-N-acetylglucosamine deacetylase, partial [Verrucomicrobiae bacterium]|nr:UDP-3-O-acyl-N-acetylglucosamine deacetylase [Verrucomicrobiae bacterium]
MLHQQTLRQAASFSGVGLHGGNRVNMTFLPAPPDSGVRFRRVDLEDNPEIEARVEFVTTTNRSTSLSKGNAKIHTVEHVLAALAGCGIDNAVIELDANEPPIADGSAREYVKMIRAAGLAPQDAPREIFYVNTPVSYQKDETSISVFPYDGFKITCTSADSKGRFTQFFSLDVTPESWERDLAHARTFCFFEEIEFLIKNGLIKGGSLENAVVIRDDAILTTEPLRYPEEFVRHKMLDIIGDLSLVGRPIAGHVIAVKPSHNANCEVSRQLSQQLRKPIEAAASFAPPPPPPGTKLDPEAIAIRDGDEIDTERLMKILPHRYPFLMVDKITKIAGNK